MPFTGIALLCMWGSTLTAMLLEGISPAVLSALLTVDGRPSIRKCTLI